MNSCRSFVWLKSGCTAQCSWLQYSPLQSIPYLF